MSYVREVTNIGRDAVRAQLGRVGVWSVALGRIGAEQERKAVAEIERLGYPTLWLNESDKEIFAHAGVALAASERLVIATGIARIWSRRPDSAVAGAQTLGEAYPGRFVLGIGVSHPRFVPDYARPLTAMREYLDGLDAAGYAPPPARPRVPLLVAALRSKMLELAATRADGATPYLVPVEHTAFARDVVGPDAVLAPELAVVLEADAGSARAIAREYLALYLTLPNYTNNLRALGYGDGDLSGGGSDRLVDALVAWGDVDAIVERVQAHLDAGADHVAVQPLTGDHGVGLDTLAKLAPALA
jgi:probable F420-dependent oxidoreductase